MASEEGYYSRFAHKPSKLTVAGEEVHSEHEGDGQGVRGTRRRGGRFDLLLVSLPSLKV